MINPRWKNHGDLVHKRPVITRSSHYMFQNTWNERKSDHLSYTLAAVAIHVVCVTIFGVDIYMFSLSCAGHLLNKKYGNSRVVVPPLLRLASKRPWLWDFSFYDHRCGQLVFLIVASQTLVIYRLPTPMLISTSGVVFIIWPTNWPLLVRTIIRFAWSLIEGPSYWVFIKRL